MSFTFPRPCVMCGARALPGTNRCALHPAPKQTEADRLAAAPYRRSYSSAEYRANRERRHELAGGRCEACGVRLGPGWECDHILPLKDGGTDELGNLRCRCRACHQAKTRSDRRRRRP